MVFVPGRVEILLSDEIRLSLVHCGQTRVNRVRVVVTGFGAFDFFGAALLDGARPLQVVLQFGHFDYREKLALLHLVADIDVYLLQKAGDFRVQVHFLIRSEFRLHHQFFREIFPADLDHGYREVADGRDARLGFVNED